MFLLGKIVSAAPFFINAARREISTISCGGGHSLQARIGHEIDP
jgi:hypothetical protein